MKPSVLCLRCLIGLAALGLFVGIARLFNYGFLVTPLTGFWTLGAAALLLLVAIDRILGVKHSALTCVRECPLSLALGVNQTLVFKITNEGQTPLSLLVSEMAPQELNIQGFPLTLELAPREIRAIRYAIRPEQRGDMAIDGTQIFVKSRLGFWHFQQHYPVVSRLKVFPNFMAVSHLALLMQGGKSQQLGIHVMQRRGQGTGFHQLRDFRDSDSWRQVDWNATAKVGKLISREFHDEKDQQVIFLLDCGRRMRAKDHALSHFDHALNALLLTAFVALRQGDAVGYHTFAGEKQGMKPAKGRTAMNTLINQLYGVQSSIATADFIQAAEVIVTARYRRSLIVLVTNVREDDEEDLIAAVRLLSRRHIVLMATLREAVLDEVVQRPIGNVDDALTYAATVEHLSSRARVISRLAAEGIVLSDCLPAELPVALVNQYLALKRSGRF